MNWSFLWPMLAAAGVPSAVFGLLMSRLHKKLDKQDAERERKELARIEHVQLLIKLNMAAISLGEATAEAVQRMPDADCDKMHEALDTARAVKAEYQKFQRVQTAQILS